MPLRLFPTLCSKETIRLIWLKGHLPAHLQYHLQALAERYNRSPLCTARSRIEVLEEVGQLRPLKVTQSLTVILIKLVSDLGLG